MQKEEVYESVEDFYKADGIVQPIRAIVNRNLFDFNKVSKVAVDVQLALAWLASDNEEEHETGKKTWRSLINSSNIIGYFSAVKISDYDIKIGYSLCKPMDWPNFNSKIGKTIAINKHSNYNWIVHAFDPKTGVCLPWIEQKLAMSKSLYNRFVNVGMTHDKNGNKAWIVFNMLGTLDDQLEHFVKRVIRYYRLDEAKKD